MSRLLQHTVILGTAALLVQLASYSLIQPAAARELANAEASAVWGGSTGCTDCQADMSYGCTGQYCRPLKNMYDTGDPGYDKEATDFCYYGGNVDNKCGDIIHCEPCIQ